jgi:hypothetical protein
MRGRHARAGLPKLGVHLAVAGVVAGALAVSASVFGLTGHGDRPRATGPASPSGPIAATPTPAPTPAPTPQPTPSPSVVPMRVPGPIPGYLLIADRGNDRMVLVNSRKDVLWAYPRPGRQPAMPFNFDDDTFFTPGWHSIISNQEEQQTIQVISFPGRKILWSYGTPNVKGSSPGLLHTPDDAYMLPGGNVSVADVGNCRVIFLSPAKKIVRQIGTTGACGHAPPRLVSSPNGDTPLPGGGTIVTEITGSWVDGIGANGKLLWSFQAPVHYPSDAQWLGNNRVLLADYSSPGHVLEMTTKGKVLWEYGPASGPGALDHPSLALPLPNGLIAVNDDFRHRVVLIDQAKDRIVWQYGHTDAAGNAPGYLNTPDGMDFLPFAVAMRMPRIRSLVLRSSPSPAPSPAPSPTLGTAPVAISTAKPLPAPVQRAVAVWSNGTIYVAGGLDASGRSVNGVFALDPETGTLTSLGSVPDPVHDAAAAFLGGRLLVFGGGSSASTDVVQAFDPSTRKGTVAGHLPRPLSDLAAATVGGTVYLVGGYDGASPQASIFSTTDGAHFTQAGTLPTGLRYAAVAASGTALVIAGGVSATGPVSTVYRFDSTTGKVSLLAHLPSAVGHAGAVALGGQVYVIGGLDSGGHALASVFEVDPTAGTVTALPDLSHPVSDAAVAGGPTGAWLLGGWDGRALAQVLHVHGR